jgi:hypothetical protein
VSGLRDHIALQTLSGESFSAGGATVTPQAQAFSLRLPFGGVVYARPTSLLIEQNGERRLVPIVDVTRMVQVALAAAVVVMILAIGTSARRHPLP